MKSLFIVLSLVIITTLTVSNMRPTPVETANENIPKITIVAKRMTEAQKQAYDQELLDEKVHIAQR